MTFFGTLATVCAALLGLYFVAISLHLKEFEDRPLLLSRARGGLRSLLKALILSVVVLIPGQRIALLGAELIAVELIWLAIILPALPFTWRAPRADTAAARVIGVTSVIAIALVFVGGLSLLEGRGPGLYLVLPNVVGVIVISTYFAWTVLFAAAPRMAGRR